MTSQNLFDCPLITHHSLSSPLGSPLSHTSLMTRERREMEAQHNVVPDSLKNHSMAKIRQFINYDVKQGIYASKK